MRHINALAKRNIRLFLRDRSALFFSFFSSLLVIAIYFIFLAGLNAEELGHYGFEFEENAKYFIIYIQIITGVLILNSMTLSAGTFVIIARDFENRRIDSLLLTPVKPRELLLGYFISALLVSFIFNCIFWILSVLLIGALTGYFISFFTFAAGFAILLSASLISASIMLLFTALIKSPAAISIISSISATFFGVLCGIYTSYSILGKGAETAGSFIPFTHITILFKQLVLKDALSRFDLPENIYNNIHDKLFAARNIGFCGLNTPQWALLLFCGIFAFLCLAAAWLILRRRVVR